MQICLLIVVPWKSSDVNLIEVFIQLMDRMAGTQGVIRGVCLCVVVSRRPGAGQAQTGAL